jgi:hypothetical protein
MGLLGLLTMSRWEAPLRFAAGAFILNSGLDKRDVPDDTAESLHEWAKTTRLPVIHDMEPDTFVDTLYKSEVALGSALLTPIVPRRLAGLGLTAFAAGLMRLYWTTPGARQEGDVRPTQKGLGQAKDLWLFAIGLALLLGGDSERQS